jgi:antitoxin YefM
VNFTLGKKIRLAKAHVIAHGFFMKTITATSARSDLYRIIDSAQSTHEPVQITGKRGNAVLVAEDDWRSIQETIYLLGIPGMRDSIILGMTEDIDDCSEEIDL